MRVGLGARLAIAFALLAAVTALVTAAVASASTNRRVNEDVDQFLRGRAADIAEGRRRPVQRDGTPFGGAVAAAADERLVARAVEADAIVQVIDRQGRRVATTGIELPIDDLDRSLTERFDPARLRTIEIDGEPFRMITVHTAGGGAVQVAQSVETTNALLGQIRTELLLVGLVLSGLAGFVGWGVATGTTRPLRHLTRSVESVRESQDLSQSIALDRADELGRLSDAFDELLRTLAASRHQQQQLVQDAAHELRTPLTSVRANIDFLERADDLDEAERRATLTSIRAELAELSDLLAEVVELATESRDAAGFEHLDLVTAAEAALAQFELRSARPVERRMKSSTVTGDPASLTRAIGNLIANADKYTPDEQAPIEVRVGGGEVVVADRGPGIPAEHRSAVFERFWRADEARSASGSGLGLAIVKKAVDEHGGTVFVRDRPGGGSEIGFRLPLA